MTDDAPQLPIEQRLRDAVATARAAGTTAAALDALCATLGWREELEGRALSPGELAALQRDIATASQALSALGLAAQPPSFRCLPDALGALRAASEWIDVLALASEALPGARAWIAAWLSRIEQLAAPLLPLLAELPLLDMVERGYPLNHACRVTADLLPQLAARCEALWTAWASASCAHPVVRAAHALRDQIRERRWRYRELVARARALAERSGVPAAAVVDWILGGAPQPLGPSDARERQRGRTGYASSDPDIVVAAVALLDIRPGDRFYDLGSGLGIPALIAALSGSATYRGIELHPRYVERARDNARRLGLASVEFVRADVTTYDWSDGTQFYLFNPFSPPVLRAVTERLREVAALHPIRVACFHNLLPDGFTRIGGEGPLAVYEIDR